MIKNIAPLETRRLIYEGIFNSVLTYCMPVWGGLSKSEMEDLQVMQNKAVRATLKNHIEQVEMRCMTLLVF